MRHERWWWFEKCVKWLNTVQGLDFIFSGKEWSKCGCGGINDVSFISGFGNKQ